ncbi:cytochrome P450 [Mycena albidolilacea]|uniref:Cytochrome P450 n=1 Tax=Mycena albidolilacea TaxID=1033008 RepID=A0AAD7EDV7_9AGAR|nr:cytochrome P450 [Mycena albidolilacea]
MSSYGPKRVALVTGAARGIGKAIALRLARDGFAVAVNDVPSHAAGLEQVVEEIKDTLNGDALACIADVSVEDEVQKMIEQGSPSVFSSVVAHFPAGRLDVIVANAGVAKWRLLVETTAEEWDTVMRVNARGTFLCYKYAAVQMIRQGGGGRIVGAASICAKRGMCTAVLLALHLRESPRSDFPRRILRLQVRYQGIDPGGGYAPGGIDTAMLGVLASGSAADSGGTPEDYLEGLKARTPMGCIGDPTDVANVVSFLASKESQFITANYIHYKFTEWSRTYGGFYSLKLASGTAIVLTDAAAVKELVEKRSATTMDRPPLHLAEVVTQGLNLVLSRYSEKWKVMRRAAQAILTPQASARHLPIQQAESIQLSFYTHIQRYSNSVILSVLYGKRAPRFETPETVTFFKVEHEWVTLLEPGATPPLDYFPFLKYVPERWANWKKVSKFVRKLQRDMYFSLLDKTQERLKRGEGNGSYVEELVERQEELELDREMLGYLPGVLIETGSETTSSYLQSLVMALVAYPEAQKKAHEEIDRVVGEHRMPTLDDLQHMPYIRAVALETHRFRPMTPFGIPHCTLAEEEYKGYVIPKGSTIFINAWGIFHDPGKFGSDLYDDPENFIPDRYLLTENGTKPGVDGSDLRPTFTFGAGRRICPGLHVAQHTINLNVMNLLWAFDFNKAIDAGGNPVEVDTMDYLPGLTSKPRAFKCRITPRTVEKAEIIRREFLEAGDTFSKFEFDLCPEDQEYVSKSRGLGK